MAFVVENGNGLDNANAYIDLAFADEYHTDRGNTKWAGEDAVKQAAIIRATDYIDKRFGPRFRGTRMRKEQALEWPRLAASDDDNFFFNGIDVIPRKLKQACAEYALRALIIGELAPDVPSPIPGQNNAAGSTPSTTVITGEVQFKKEVVGPLEEVTSYRTLGETMSELPQTRDPISGLVNTFSIPEYPAADLLLVELLKSRVSRRIVRG